MQCAVLTLHMPYASTTQCAVLTERIPYVRYWPWYALRLHYAMCGTELAYAATRHCRPAPRRSRLTSGRLSLA
eukprot:2156609-Rhodomonas_salina.1